MDPGKHATSVIGFVFSTLGASRLERGGGLEEGGVGRQTALWMTESMLEALASQAESSVNRTWRCKGGV